MEAASIMEDIKKLTDKVATSMTALRRTWNDIGFSETTCKERTDVVFLHLCNLLNEMVSEENDLKVKLESNVEDFSEKLSKLCDELAMPHYEPGDMTLLHMEKEMRHRVDDLAKIKHERMKMLKTLKQTEQHLCDNLSVTPYYIASGVVPSQSQLDELTQHIATLRAEKEKRLVTFLDLKSKLVKLFEELEHTPDTSFQRDILCETNDEAFQLSTANLQALQELNDGLVQQQKDNYKLAGELRDRLNCLWERLETPSEERKEIITNLTGFRPKVISELKAEIARCELLKFQNMKKFVEGTRRELVAWWEKCFFSPQDREKFQLFHSEDYTEDLLEVHDAELTKVKQYYKDNEDLLDRLNKREELWSQFLLLEKKAHDPNRFTNRGGNLLVEEKQRKKMLKDLPKVEEELSELIGRWEDKTQRQFLLKGMKFKDFITYQWDKLKTEREQEKINRHKQKAKVLEEEMIYGSKPNASKRRFLGTPSKTPNKLRKLNDTQKTPGSVSRINHTSIFASPAVGGRPPKSASRSVSTANKTPRRVLRSSIGKSRRILSDKNTNNTTLRSGHVLTTTVNGGAKDSTALSFGSSLSYQDFTNGINNSEKANIRSSVLVTSGYSTQV